MKLAGFLVLTFFCFSTGAFSDKVKLPQNCDKIEAEVEVVNTSDGRDNGRAKVKMIKGDLKNIKYIFCVESGKVLNEDQFQKNSLDGLKRGEYFCIVSNSDCSKKISFTIK